MYLYFDSCLSKGYKNTSQKIRVLSEAWVSENGYCPNCGAELEKFENNRPVADFFCRNCQEEFELKSKNSKKVGKKVANGSYYAKIERILSDNNPNFFILTYDKTSLKVLNFLVIPKYFFTPEIIEKRKALSDQARRAGWIGSNILLSEIPDSGKIYIVKDSKVVEKDKVLEDWQKIAFMRKQESKSRGWILEVMRCIDAIGKEYFSLKELYEFEPLLKRKYPDNKHIKEKIRQQLQLLRDNGVIEFLGNGSYRKL